MAIEQTRLSPRATSTAKITALNQGPLIEKHGRIFISCQVQVEQALQSRSLKNFLADTQPGSGLQPAKALWDEETSILLFVPIDLTRADNGQHIRALGVLAIDEKGKNFKEYPLWVFVNDHGEIIELHNQKIGPINQAVLMREDAYEQLSEGTYRHSDRTPENELLRIRADETTFHPAMIIELLDESYL